MEHSGSRTSIEKSCILIDTNIPKQHPRQLHRIESVPPPKHADNVVLPPSTNSSRPYRHLYVHDRYDGASI